MKVQTLAAVLAASVATSAATLPRKQSAHCESPAKRIEWRQLKASDQQSYIDAVLCLKTKPSRIGLDTPLYDDFAHVHFELNRYIHGGPPFLPWHRYFSKVYQDALRGCGYDGPGTYWDWSLDNDALRYSPVMSDELGFGGNGDSELTELSPDGSELKCVSSGPFKDLRPAYLAISPVDITSGGHCLWRNLPEVSEPDAFESMRASFSPEGVDNTLSSGNWTDFARSLEGGPHGAIHASLGGDMNPTTSPNEPLFFLHHAQVDRIWWLWQQENSDRLTEYSGEAAFVNETDMREVSLDDVLLMGGLAKDVKVRDVMDTRSDRICLTY